MKPDLICIAAATAAILLSFPAASAAQERLSDRDVRELAQRIDKDAERFESSLERGIDHSTLNDTWEEEEINDAVHRFEEAADRLDDHLDDRGRTTETVREILRRAAMIDRFVGDRPIGTVAQGDWEALRTRLDDLARAYGISWYWQLGTDAAVAPARRLSDDEMRRLIERIEENTDRLDDSLGDDLDDSRAETRGKALLKSLDAATDRLRDTFDDDRQASGLVGRVLWEAGRLEQFLAGRRLGTKARGDWEQLRGQLRELARGYGIEFSPHSL